MSYAIVQNDLEPDMILTLSVNGAAEDLSDIDEDAIVLNWKKPDGSTTTALLESVTLSIGQVRRVWATDDTEIPGRHYGQVTVIRGNGERQTFPNTKEFFSWEVIPLIGA